MTRFVEMTAHKLVGPHLKPGQGQVGLQVNIRHMAPTPSANRYDAKSGSSRSTAASSRSR